MQAPGPLIQGTAPSYRHSGGQDKALGDILCLLGHTALISAGDNSALLFKAILSCQLEPSHMVPSPEDRLGF